MTLCSSECRSPPPPQPLSNSPPNPKPTRFFYCTTCTSTQSARRGDHFEVLCGVTALLYGCCMAWQTFPPHPYSCDRSLVGGSQGPPSQTVAPNQWLSPMPPLCPRCVARNTWKGAFSVYCNENWARPPAEFTDRFVEGSSLPVPCVRPSLISRESSGQTAPKASCTSTMTRKSVPEGTANNREVENVGLPLRTSGCTHWRESPGRHCLLCLPHATGQKYC